MLPEKKQNNFNSKHEFMQLLLLIKKIGRIFPVILCSVQNFTRIMGDRKERGSGGFSWENVAKHKTHISDFRFNIFYP